MRSLASIGCSLFLATSGCADDPCYYWEADSSSFCDGDLVKTRYRCTDGGGSLDATNVSTVRDCGAIGAKCQSGVCVSREEVCPDAHQSFCDAAGARSCVGDAVAVGVTECLDDQRCIEVVEAGVTRAQCALSDVPCSRELGQCDGSTLVTCSRGFPVSRTECTGLASRCTERPDSDDAVCLAPQCETSFSGSLCDGDRVIQCTPSESSLRADCGAEGKRCVRQADTAFCSATGEIETLHWQQIPGGAFTFENQSSQLAVDLAGFEILTHEVTVAQYQLCVDAGACALLDGENPQVDTNLPLVSVRENNASQFCLWLGGRLPAETEWQYVATNLGTTLFPWGDAPPSCELSVLGSPVSGTDPDCRGAAAEVCSVPGDQTALGVCDLGGNVSELVVIPGHPDTPYALGGNFETPADTLSLLLPEPNSAATTGFRCVR